MRLSSSVKVTTLFQICQVLLKNTIAYLPHICSINLIALCFSQKIIASIIFYKCLITNAGVTYVAVKDKYASPNVIVNDVDFESCLAKAAFPDLVVCYLMFSPSQKTCSFFVAPFCSDSFKETLLKDSAKDDTTLYMRVTSTAGSSNVNTLSQTHSVMSTTARNFLFSTIQTLSSDFTSASANSDIMSSSSRSFITPTPTENIAKSTFISMSSSIYQEMFTITIKMVDSTQQQLAATDSTFDLPEVTQLKPTSILMTSSSEIIPTAAVSLSNFPNSVYNTTFEMVINEENTTLLEANTITMTPDRNSCQCKCFEAQPLTDKKLASLRNELTVNKSTLSRTIRSKTSAPDNRPSATGIGMAGVLILVACLVLLIASDFQVLCQHAYIMKTNLMSRVK